MAQREFFKSPLTPFAKGGKFLISLRIFPNLKGERGELGLKKKERTSKIQSPMPSIEL
jgi:hypothetical protein